MYPHCLHFLELFQNANFRTSMAHPGSKELAHRQQFYFWKNYRNNRLKHILPRSLPEPAPALPQASITAPPPLPTAPPTSAPSPTLCPMQYTMPPGSSVGKNDMKSSGIDRRKRNYEQGFDSDPTGTLNPPTICEIKLKLKCKQPR